MCGICGLLSFDSGPTAGTLTAMNSCIEHRGPDEEGIFIDRALGLAHQRLSIIDPETGNLESLLIPETGGMFNLFQGEEALVIPWESIIKIGDEIIIVDLVLQEDG